MGRRVTKDDVRFVYENYATMSAGEIAEARGLTKNQVTNIVSRLRKAGIDLPRKGGKRENPVEEFVRELKTESY